MADTTVSTLPARWRDVGWRAVAAAFVFNGFLFGLWASRVPAFKARFDLEPGTLGLLLLLLAGGAIASFPLAGALSERWGAARFAWLCALGYAPALILLAFAPTVATLAVALALFGAFHGSMDVAMNGWAARVEARLRRPTMSVFHALFSLGAGLGALSGFFAVQAGWEPELHYVTFAILGAALSLPLMARGLAAEPSEVERSESAPLFAWPSGALILVGLVAFSSSMGEGAMADWSAVFMTVVKSADEAQAALGYAAFSTSMVAMRLMGDGLVLRFGPALATRASGGAAMAGLVLAILAPGPILTLMGFALVGLGYAVMMPLAFSRAAADPGMRPGPAIASVATLGYGGMLLGPAVIGFIAEATNLSVSFGALALLALLPILLGGRMAVPGR